jgi:hypothetical membrane protein
MEQIASRAWRTPYLFAQNYISDLGAVRCASAAPTGLTREVSICSPLHAWMNLSFVLQGMLICTGAILLRRLMTTCPWSAPARWFLVLSGVGLVVVGLAPEDVHSSIHFSGAAAHLFLGDLGVGLLGFALRRHASHVSKALATSVGGLGLLGLLATLMVATHRFVGIGAGAMERISAYPIPISLSMLGAAFLWRSGSKVIHKA